MSGCCIEGHPCHRPFLLPFSPGGPLSSLRFPLCSPFSLPSIPSVSLSAPAIRFLFVTVFPLLLSPPSPRFRAHLYSVHFLSFRMVGDDDDEGALSDSDGHSGLAADDLASKWELHVNGGRQVQTKHRGRKGRKQVMTGGMIKLATVTLALLPFFIIL